MSSARRILEGLPVVNQWKEALEMHKNPSHQPEYFVHQSISEQTCVRTCSPKQPRNNVGTMTKHSHVVHGKRTGENAKEGFPARVAEVTPSPKSRSLSDRAVQRAHLLFLCPRFSFPPLPPLPPLPPGPEEASILLISRALIVNCAPLILPIPGISTALSPPLFFPPPLPPPPLFPPLPEAFSRMTPFSLASLLLFCSYVSAALLIPLRMFMGIFSCSSTLPLAPSACMRMSVVFLRMRPSAKARVFFSVSAAALDR